jgi:hypothetical protein
MGFLLFLLCSVLVLVLVFALFGIGFGVCPVWYRSDTEITELLFGTGSWVKD